jgi:hypothetical protein
MTDTDAITDLARRVTELEQLAQTFISARQTAHQNDADRLRDIMRLEREIAALRARLDAWDEIAAVSSAAVLSDPDLMRAIADGEADIAVGRVTPWAEMNTGLQASKGDDNAD